MKIVDRISLLLTIIGALNWLLVGLFSFDLVAFICGGSATVAARIIYAVIGITALWSITLLFRRIKPVTEA